MPCGPCNTQSAITDSSAALVNNFGTNSQFSGVLTTLLRSLDQVELRQRVEAVNVPWKPSLFPQKIVDYGRKPEGTEVVSINTPLYFEENKPFVYDLYTPGPEGGICDGSSLCGEPPANKVPGDTYQTFTWRMQGTAWETPTFCLKDLLFYDNGMDTLRRFLVNVERTPFDFYNNFIRNLIWDTGEKYFLAATDLGLLWNSPDRVSARVAPNLIDFKANSTSDDVGAPRLVALQALKYILSSFMGDDASPLNVEGGRDLMMVSVEADVFNMVYNDTDGAGNGLLTSYIQGGMGFNLHTFNIIPQLPFAVKNDDAWFRGDFDANGEFVRIPAKVYVQQNGGAALRTNPAWLTAPYGVMTFMTPRPFTYRKFGSLPSVPGQVPDSATRYLSPRFQFVPLLEKCNYARGLVAWRAEDEFGFQPTGEKIIHVIYRRDELASYIRQAKAGSAIAEITPVRATIPVTCSKPEVLGCCAVAGAVVSAVDYRDTAYSVTYTAGAVDYFGWDVDGLPDTPISAQFKTAKGTFDVIIVAVSSDGTKITFYVDPDQHTGGHFCCTDQLIGFILEEETPYCQALLEGGLRPDPFVPTRYIGVLSRPIDAIATDTVKVFFDASCGIIDGVDFVVYAIDNSSRRITLTVNTALFPDGIDCADAVKVCAYTATGCEGCVDSDPAACVSDDVTAIPMGDDDHEESAS